MALWTCEHCQATNGPRARACETCGTDRTSPSAPRDADAWRCIWTDRGQRCRMPGAIGNTHGYRCSWHYHALTNPSACADFDEFERWVVMLQEAPYCSVWTHDPVSALWEAVHGRAPLPSRPLPCQSPSCEYAAVPEPWLSPREAFAAIRRMGARLCEGESMRHSPAIAEAEKGVPW